MAQQLRIMNQLRAMYEAQGCVVTNGKKGLRVKCPDGTVITVHYTPKNNGDHLNVLRQETRRHGLEWQL